MTEPTREEIQEFWEKCGLQEVIDGNYHKWYDSEGHLICGGVVYNIPEVSLDNLFKYAVPKLDWFMLTEYRFHHGHFVAIVDINGADDDLNGEAVDKDPAIALFRAIQQVFKEVK